MRILVTGASGFIGGNIAETLASNKQYNVLATGRSNTTRFNNYKNVDYFTLNLCEQIKDIITCDICIHCAGIADDQSTIKQLTLNNVQSTKNLLASLQNCKLFIYISSSSVYDFSDGKIKSEEDSCFSKNISLYGRSKLQAENLIKSYGIQSTYILRPRAVYGKGDRVLLPRIIKLIKKNTFIVPGALNTRGSLTHINNLCEAVIKSIYHNKLGVHVFNIADKEEYYLQSIFRQLLLKKYGTEKFIHIPVFLVKFLITLNSLVGRKSQLSKQSLDYVIQNSVLNVKKAEEELKYVGEYEFFSSIMHLDI